MLNRFRNFPISLPVKPVEVFGVRVFASVVRFSINLSLS
jgi:hypothetical protein